MRKRKKVRKRKKKGRDMKKGKSKNELKLFPGRLKPVFEPRGAGEVGGCIGCVGSVGGCFIT